jgi:SlyX protein
VTTPSAEHRLAELEIKATLAEDMLDGLSKTIYLQQQQIEQLQRQVVALRQQLQAMPPAQAPSASDETPPHY